MGVTRQLENAGNRLEKAISPAAHATNYMGMITLWILILITVTEIIIRKALDISIPGIIEVSSLLLALTAFLVFTYCELNRGHISISVAIANVPRRAGAVINTIMYLLFLGSTSFLVYIMADYGKFVMQGGRVTSELVIPLFPFYWVGAFCFLIFSLMLLAHVLLYIAEALKK